MNTDEAQADIEKFGAARLQRSLRLWREDAQLSQQELAAATGVAQQTISRLEKGTRNLTPEVFARVATFLLDAYDEKEREKARVQSSQGKYITLGSLVLPKDASPEKRQVWFAEFLKMKNEFSGAAKETHDKVKDRLIEAQAKYIKLLEEADQAKSQELADLKERISEYKDLLNIRTTETVSRAEGDELQARIEQREKE